MEFTTDFTLYSQTRRLSESAHQRRLLATRALHPPWDGASLRRTYTSQSHR